MVRTYFADITPLLQLENYEKYYLESPKWRQQKADRIRHHQDKARSIGAWTLFSMAAERSKVAKNCVYNLSHSGPYVLCSLCDEGEEVKVGCDVEVMSRPGIKIARRFFCDSEYARLLQVSEEEQTELFYRYWVLKESFLKATRQGMKLALDSFEIGFTQTGHPVLLRQPEAFPETYMYQEYKVEGAAAKIAVCTTGCPAPHIEVLRLEDRV